MKTKRILSNFLIVMVLSFTACEKNDEIKKEVTRPTETDAKIALQKFAEKSGQELIMLKSNLKSDAPFFEASATNSRGSLYWLGAWFNYSGCLPTGHVYWLKYWVYNWNQDSWTVVQEDGRAACLTDFESELHTMYDGHNTFIKVYVEAWDWGTDFVYLGYAESQWLYLPEVIL